MLASSYLLVGLSLGQYYLVKVRSESASTFAGATSTALFPPPNATKTATDLFFPDGAEVGFAGPTPSVFSCIV